MACNRDEAFRAMEIAKRKMESKDFVGAQKFALKAQQLFSDLGNISQMLAVCNVHCSSAIKVVGPEMDWYGILQVEHTADEALIKRQYKKLAFLLHPDKNKFAGAEAAFKLIGEANRVLSDHAKRTLYDMKRATSERNIGKRHVNKKSNPRKHPNCKDRVASDGTPQSPSMASQHTQSKTFWTACPFCGTRYQYYEIIINRALKCQKCQKLFIAYAINAKGTQTGANSGRQRNSVEIAQQKEVPNQGLEADCQIPSQSSKVGHQIPSQGSKVGHQIPSQVSKVGHQIQSQVSEVGHQIPSQVLKVDHQIPSPGSNVGHQIPSQGSKVGHQDTTKNKFSCSSFQGDKMPESVLKTECDSNFGQRSQNMAAERHNYEAKKPMEFHKQTKVCRKRKKLEIEESSESFVSDSTDEDEVCVKDDLPAQRTETSVNNCPRRSTRQKQHVTYNEDISDEDAVHLPGSKKLKSEGVSGEAVDAKKNEVESEEGYVAQIRVPENVASMFEEIRIDKQKGEVPFSGNLPNGNEQSGMFMKDVEQEEVDKKVDLTKDEGNSNKDFTFAMDDDNAQSDLQPVTYAEPEFHDFENDRTKNHFAVNQTWAVYDDDGCMPRFYVRIKKIIPEQSRLVVTWLEPFVNLDNHDEVAWVQNRLPFACGSFRNGGKGDVNFSSLSYLLSWKNEWNGGNYMVYPRKGEIWALFKEWNIKWSSYPNLRREYSYEIVQVLSDYDKVAGVKVACLAKLKGFVSLFYQKRNVKGSFLIPSNEILRFSHKIPSHRMTGKERTDVPEGSYELDPAALPTGIEEYEFQDFKFSDHVVVDVEHTNSCLNSATDSFECEIRVKHTELKKNIKERDNTYISQGPSPKSRNVAFDERRQCTDSARGSRDDFANDKKGGSNATTCMLDEEKHFDSSESCPVSTAKTDGSSCPPYTGDDFDYPESEFYVFDLDKSKDKFQRGQIWALYSDVDSLPKFYGQIKEVSSTDFKVDISWLDAYPIQGALWWSNETLPIGCGDFCLSDHTATFITPLTFSHQVHAEHLSEREYSICPKTGEFWAVYKKLSVDWTHLDLVNCGYDVVRILYNNIDGVRVMFLEKVVGYNSVFKDGGLEMNIRRSDFLIFSHQIPSFSLTDERGGKLRGFWELDPSAVPPILFF